MIIPPPPDLPGARRWRVAVPLSLAAVQAATEASDIAQAKEALDVAAPAAGRLRQEGVEGVAVAQAAGRVSTETETALDMAEGWTCLMPPGPAPVMAPAEGDDEDVLDVICAAEDAGLHELAVATHDRRTMQHEQWAVVAASTASRVPVGQEATTDAVVGARGVLRVYGAVAAPTVATTGGHVHDTAQTAGALANVLADAVPLGDGDARGGSGGAAMAEDATEGRIADLESPEEREERRVAVYATWVARGRWTGPRAQLRAEMQEGPGWLRRRPGRRRAFPHPLDCEHGRTPRSLRRLRPQRRGRQC